MIEVMQWWVLWRLRPKTILKSICVFAPQIPWFKFHHCCRRFRKLGKLKRASY